MVGIVLQRRIDRLYCTRIEQKAFRTYFIHFFLRLSDACDVTAERLLKSFSLV